VRAGPLLSSFTAGPRLVEALRLADHVSPGPTESSAAMKVLRLALADSLAMTLPELLASAEGYEREAERVSDDLATVEGSA
jgi:hypothetical protein